MSELGKGSTHNREVLAGKVLNYYRTIGVASIKVSTFLEVGGLIHVKGHTTDFDQKVESLHIKHRHVSRASAGEIAGLRVKDYVRKHDCIYRREEARPEPVKAKNGSRDGQAATVPIVKPSTGEHMEQSKTPGSQWYAVHVRSRHEFKVVERLSMKDIETFLPAVERVSRWKDRKKTVAFPLFPGYSALSTQRMAPLFSFPRLVALFHLRGQSQR